MFSESSSRSSSESEEKTRHNLRRISASEERTRIRMMEFVSSIGQLRVVASLPLGLEVDWNGYLRKGRKTKPKRQNRTRNGKTWKRQSPVKQKA
ncbi:hypothetical protein Tco_1398114 [Tanacetum coccineum]